MTGIVVGVSMRVVQAVGYVEPRDAVSHDWIRLFATLPVTPVLIPNALPDPAAYLRAAGASGLLLTGGNDLASPDQEVPSAAPERDRTELALLAAAVDTGLPVLAVCRGLQLVNRFFGGTLVRDLTGRGAHTAVDHPVRLHPVSGLDLPLPATATVNSFHDQAVLATGVGKGLQPFATANHDVVEGLVHRRHPVVAVQWHPERPNPAAALDRALLNYWIAQCG
jgi:gamma-glutamyl-gamma-aminobutyrate hydrolase PuuD